MPSWLGLKKGAQTLRKEPAFDEKRKPTPSLPTVMLVLAQPFTIDAEHLFDVLRSRYRKDDGTEPLVSVTEKIVSFAGVAVAILTVPHPLPEGWRELALPGRNPHWPKALEVCAPHRAHMVLSVMGEQSNLLRAMRVLTGVAGAIAALYPNQVLAGLWGAKILNSREAWEKLSVLSFTPYPNLPISLWVSQHLFQDEKSGAPGVLTQGLSRFVGRELELMGTNSDLKSLMDRAVGLTAYLVQNGPVLKDGSTFGSSATERTTVSLRESDRFPGLLVIAASLA